MDSTRAQDHYEVLGVPENADAVEIRRAFRGRVKEIHPDVSADKVGANEAFIRLKEAYTVLSDQERRAQYDASRASTRAYSAGQARARAHQAQTGQGRTHQGRTYPGGFREPSGPTYPPPGGDTWQRYHRDLTVPDLLQRAMREMAAGRGGYARRDLAEVLAREPENPDALVLMGRLYQAEGKVQDWIKVLEEGVRKNPGHAALRLALNEARRSMAEGRMPTAPISEADLEARRRAYLAGGMVSGALVMGWGALQPGEPFFLSVLVPVGTPLILGAMLCALIAGWTMAAIGYLTRLDDELLFQDAHNPLFGRRRRSRQTPSIGLAIPLFALFHYFLALGVMAALMLARGAVSRSLLIVVGSAFALSFFMGLAAPHAVGAIISWCPGWLMFALFTGWMIGDIFR